MLFPELLDILTAVVPKAAAAEGDAHEKGNRDSDAQGKDDKNSENKDSSHSSSDHDVQHEAPSHESSSGERDRDARVETSDRHPLGDYSKAIFDYAKDRVDKMAAESERFNDLKAIFDEASRARDLYESWAKATDSTPLQTRSAGTTFYTGTLVPDYVKIELLGLYLGLIPSSDTGGVHNTNSAHYKAGAVDFDVRGLSMPQIEQAKWMLRTAGALVRNEIGRPLKADGKTPQEKWSNPHLHAQSVELTKENGDFGRWSEPHFVSGTELHWQDRSAPSGRVPDADRSKIPSGWMDKLRALMR